MSRIRGEEAWARACIRAALGDAEVRQNDDGSKPGMHDLDIVYENRPPAAVEITAAADAESIELWNVVGAGEAWVEPDLVGGWQVALLPDARAGRLRRELPAFLKQLEEQGSRDVDAGRWQRGPVEDAAFSLGIARLFQSGTDRPGSIYLTIHLPLERVAGVVAATGDSLPEWIAEWIRQPTQAHNLEKLRNSGAGERHLFVILPAFADAPFAVVDLLFRDDPPLPTSAPSLPPDLTHIWAMSTWTSGSGIRWAPEGGWMLFNKIVDEDGPIRVTPPD